MISLPHFIAKSSTDNLEEIGHDQRSFYMTHLPLVVNTYQVPSTKRILPEEGKLWSRHDFVYRRRDRQTNEQIKTSVPAEFCQPGYNDMRWLWAERFIANTMQDPGQHVQLATVARCDGQIYMHYYTSIRKSQYYVNGKGGVWGTPSN